MMVNTRLCLSRCAWKSNFVKPVFTKMFLKWRTSWKIRVAVELAPALSMRMANVGVAKGGMALK